MAWRRLGAGVPGMALVILALCAAVSCPVSHGPCTSSGDCVAGEVCIDEQCRTACNTDRQCAEDEVCLNGACLEAWRQDRDAGGSRDGAAADAGAPDSPVRDVSLERAPVDVAAPDTAAPDTAAADAQLPSCQEAYGLAPGFLLCDETQDSCRFYAATGGAGCDQLCGSLGGQCLAATNNATGTGVPSCQAAEEVTCSRAFTDQICTCSRAVSPVDAGGLDRAIPDTARPDALAPDLSQPDTAQPDTAQPDTAQPDTWQPDTWQPDTWQPDTWQPDTWVEDSWRPPCAETFGVLRQFVLCVETEDSCEFNMRVNHETCQQECADVGSTCIDAYEAATSDCSRGAQVGCLDTAQLTIICVCER